VQIYRNNRSSFNRELNQKDLQLAKDHIPTGVGIITGLRGKPVKFNLINEQIDSARQKGFGGVSFFFYESLWNFGPETPQQRQDYFNNIFAQKVDRLTVKKS
jgi:uncharacterized lipoprotein YddW (UPF0748 family)